MATSRATIHQLAHGYFRGHRLLGGSFVPGDELAALINRMSDTAPNYRSSSGPYVTGYELPGGGYALARTWPAPEAGRPNAVWTHTLVLSPTVVGRVTSGLLVRLFRRPHEADAVGFGEPIEIDELVMARQAMLVEPSTAWLGLGVYAHDKVTLPPLPADAREGVALALWDQQWMPVRRTFNFCTAPGAMLFGDQRRSLLVSTHRTGATDESAVRSDGREWDLIVTDLRVGSPFRDWLHFVASGERDHRLIETFATFYLALSESGPSATRLQDVIPLLEAKGPATTDLRRLKRWLLSSNGVLWRRGIEPVEVFRALVEGSLGRIVAADDAALDRWFAAAWKSDPRGTMGSLAASRGAADASEDSSGSSASHVQSAAEAVGRVFHDRLRDFLTPDTLPMAAEAVPTRVLRMLLSRNEAPLWRAWTRLPVEVRQRTLTHAEGIAAADWSIALRSLRHDPEVARELVAEYPETVPYLVEVMASERARSDQAVQPLSRSAAHIVRMMLQVEADPDRVRALSYLASPDDLPKSAMWDAWQRVLAQGDGVVGAIGYLIGRSATGRQGRMTAAVALPILYDLLAREPGGPIWDRLQNGIDGDAPEWDRCQRLADDFARILRKVDEHEAALLLSAVNERSSQAAWAVSQALDEKPPQGRWRIWDLLPW